MPDPYFQLERFVDAATAADFLALRSRRVLELARAGELPAHPIGHGKRRIWRFRLSELAAAVSNGVDSRQAVPGSQKARTKR